MVDWGRVEAVFSEAVELEGDARAAYLDRECEGDTQLKREVERLLRSLDSAGTFLAKPLLRVDTEVLSPDEAVPLQRLGQMVGDYKLVDVLGRGGMGVVYLATREGEFERKVALKLIEGWAPPALIERFERERQVLAGLEHPYIARMYEGGTTEDNQPYLVMEYVAGLPLEQYCQDKGLSVSKRLRLFLKVCAGVAYAHRNLLVHRDLKPSNILVTAEGVPKLLDFGIAKSLDPEAGAGMTTTQGPSPMTLAYASPEQVRGEAISTASDVYSLGVVLYKLIAGRFPYREMEDSFELGKEIVDGEVPRPSTSVSAAGHELKGDIDAITLRALRKDPEERYPSVEAFSLDIERHLTSLPVLAREGDLRDQVQKFVRRNRWGLTAAITAVAVIAVFTIAQMRASTIAKREQDRAEQALEVLLEAFKVSDPEISRGRVVTAREILDGGAEAVRKGAQDPELQATLFGAIGDIYVSLAEFDQAEQLHLEALELRKTAEVDVGLSLYQLGELEWSRRDYVAAEPYYRDALKSFPGGTIEHARCLRGLGLALVWLGQAEEGEIFLHEALSVLEDRFIPSDPEILRVVEGLAWIARNEGQYKKASKLFEELVEARRSDGKGPALGRSLAELGNVRRLQGRLEEARALLEEALPMLRESMGAHNSYVGEMLGKLVPALWRLGDFESAEVAIDEVLRILPDSHPGTATALHNLALILTDRGELEEAEKVARQALERQRAIFDEKHENIAYALCNLGRIALKRKDFATALREYKACAGIYPKGDPRQVLPFWGMGRSTEELEGCSAAVTWYRRAVEVGKDTLDQDHPLMKQVEKHLKTCLQ